MSRRTCWTSWLTCFFGHLSAKQIATLKKIGFCLTTTINSYLPLTNPGFQICMGSNTPVDSMVLAHRPTKNETILRTSTLLKILNSLHRPRLVTVCRSVRDGYTPRFQYYLIEHGVMKAISSVFSNVKVHYDPWLLGGKHGWPHRHKSSWGRVFVMYVLCRCVLTALVIGKTYLYVIHCSISMEPSILYTGYMYIESAQFYLVLLQSLQWLEIDSWG